MPGASRLTAAGGSGDSFIAPKTGPKSGSFDPGFFRRDIRKNISQLITLTGFAGVDSFTITFGRLGTTAAFVRGTNATAAAIQTALRTLTGDSGLTVAGDTDEGPFTVTFSGSRLTNGQPWKLFTINGTGCTGVATAITRPETLMGQSRLTDSADSSVALVPPTIGTITVTDSTNEVFTLDFSAGTDAGTFRLSVDGVETDDIAYNATWDEVATELDAAFLSAGYAAADAPTVAGKGTSDVQTIELGDIAAADTYKLTFNTHATGTITYEADSSVAIKAALEALADFEPGDILSVVSVDDDTYTVTFDPSLGNVGAITITNASGFTPTGVTHTATGAQDGFTFTFDGGEFEGQPVDSDPNGPSFAVADDSLLDTPVAEPATFSVTTAGVRGSMSAAYTEQATVGDSVIAVCVQATTGVTYDAIVDASTPVVFDGLDPGTYYVYMATVANRRVSRWAQSVLKTVA